MNNVSIPDDFLSKFLQNLTTRVREFKRALTGHWGTRLESTLMMAIFIRVASAGLGLMRGPTNTTPLRRGQERAVDTAIIPPCREAGIRISAGIICIYFGGVNLMCKMRIFIHQFFFGVDNFV